MSLSEKGLPITEDWLKQVGFKWQQFDRQPSKQWLLWLGSCLECGTAWRFSGPEDIGIEVAAMHPLDPNDDRWFCWLRSDVSHRYGRFIHLRHIRTQGDLIALVKAITGRAWKPENHIYGSHRCQTCGDRWRTEEMRRLDLQRLHEGPHWYEHEKDTARAGANSGHLQAAIEGGKAQ